MKEKGVAAPHHSGGGRKSEMFFPLVAAGGGGDDIAPDIQYSSPNGSNALSHVTQSQESKIYYAALSDPPASALHSNRLVIKNHLT